jgi:hypothetical protein
MGVWNASTQYHRELPRNPSIDQCASASANVGSAVIVLAGDTAYKVRKQEAIASQIERVVRLESATSKISTPIRQIAGTTPPTLFARINALLHQAVDASDTRERLRMQGQELMFLAQGPAFVRPQKKKK